MSSERVGSSIIRCDGGETGTASNSDRPTCDHRDCRPDPNPAVAQHEFIDPPARTFRAWTCVKHEPDMPAIKRVDPGPDNRTLHTESDRGDS